MQVKGQKWALQKISMMAQVWMSVKSLPRFNKVKTRLLKSARRVIMMEVKPIMIEQQRYRIQKMRVRTNLIHLGMWCLTGKLCICNVDCVHFNVYFVLSFRVTCLSDLIILVQIILADNWKGWIRIIEMTTQVWIGVNYLPHWRSHGSQLHREVWQVIILA